jgi:hypothetical protein
MNRLNGHNANGRNGKGQFAPGNAGGPGRPRRATECDYLRTLNEECPLETWAEICQRAVADAIAGDSKARDWLSRYVLGNPAELPTLKALASYQEGRT